MNHRQVVAGSAVLAEIAPYWPLACFMALRASTKSLRPFMGLRLSPAAFSRPAFFARSTL